MGRKKILDPDDFDLDDFMDEEFEEEEEEYESTSGNWLTRLIFRPSVLFALAGIAIIALLAPVLPKLLPDLRERDEYHLSSSQIEISPPPHWVPHDLVDQVVKSAELPETLSILETGLTEEIAHAFSLHPWVAEVIEVKKSMPARLQVELKYREPVAMIRVKRGWYPVDVEAILLPSRDFSKADINSYPIVENVQSVPQGPSGTSWGDPVVSAAASLAEELAPHWSRLKLESIRLPRRTTANTDPNEIRFELIAQCGSRIIWGRPPGSNHPGELSVKQKIGKLDKYLEDFGGFDKPAGPYEIDIRPWQETSRRPISSRPSTQKF